MAPRAGQPPRQGDEHPAGRRRHAPGPFAGSALRAEPEHGAVRRRPAAAPGAAARRAPPGQPARRRPARHRQRRGLRQADGRSRPAGQRGRLPRTAVRPHARHAPGLVPRGAVDAVPQRRHLPAALGQFRLQVPVGFPRQTMRET